MWGVIIPQQLHLCAFHPRKIVSFCLTVVRTIGPLYIYTSSLGSSHPFNHSDDFRVFFVTEQISSRLATHFAYGVISL